jgi:hypothetical protein
MTSQSKAARKDDRGNFLNAIQDVLGELLREKYGIALLKDIKKNQRGVKHPVLARLVMHVSFEYTEEYVVLFHSR